MKCKLGKEVSLSTIGCSWRHDCGTSGMALFCKLGFAPFVWQGERLGQGFLLGLD